MWSEKQENQSAHKFWLLSGQTEKFWPEEPKFWQILTFKNQNFDKFWQSFYLKTEKCDLNDKRIKVLTNFDYYQGKLKSFDL